MLGYPQRRLVHWLRWLEACECVLGLGIPPLQGKSHYASVELKSARAVDIISQYGAESDRLMPLNRYVFCTTGRVLWLFGFSSDHAFSCFKLSLSMECHSSWERFLNQFVHDFNL